ncbi:MAG: ABC transporter ATP-binding protein [Thermoanaerobaculia bacterium]
MARSSTPESGSLRRLAALRPYLRRYRRRLVAGLVCVAGAAAFGLASPIVVGRAVDTFRREVSPRTLLIYAGVLVGITLVQGLFTFSQRLLLVTLSRNIEFDLRNDYFAHLERLPLAFYQRSYTGDLMARGTNDLQAVRMLCGPAIMYSSNTLFTATGALFFMARIHGGLTLLALCTLPLVAVATNLFGRRIHRLFQKVQEQFSALSASVQENLAGVRVVRAYAREASELRRFERLSREYVERNRRLIRWTSAFYPLLQGLVGIGFVAVLWYGGSLVAQQTISVGQFVTFIFFLAKLIWPMIAIGWVINMVQRGSASLMRLLEIMETEPEVRDEEPLVALEEVRGAVRFRDLTFAYEQRGEPVLREIAFDAPAGSTVAVVGRTGAGKSTLLALIGRLMNPPEGAVFVDGVDVRRLRLAELRAALAMVPQETFLMSASVGENIAFGRPDAQREEIREAARAAGLDEELASFPKGLDTLVGERGITLSGGQKQRVALARALLRRPRILLLDDCLSAVDTQTEEKILTNLRRVFPGRTVFLISHRISAVQDADLILVLDRGRIVERGTHGELVAAGGLYEELYRKQLLEEELAAV